MGQVDAKKRRNLPKTLEGSMRLINLTILAIAISVSSCYLDGNDEQGLKYSNPDDMENLMLIMEEMKIPYRFSEGTIWYQYKFIGEVQKTEKMLSSASYTRYENPKFQEYFKSVLEEENIEYFSVKKDSVDSVMWWPTSEEVSIEVNQKVAELYYKKEFKNGE